MEDHPLLLRSLSSTKANTTTEGANNVAENFKVISSNSGIVSRLILISLVGFIAIWANNEASKGFRITIVNEAGDSTAAGKRFSLFYVSDDKATRIVLNTSKFVENILYPDDQDHIHAKKQVNHVILRLARHNLSEKVIVESLGNHEFVINLSPIVMEEMKYNKPCLIISAIHRGMARVWLWDGNGNTPQLLINGLVEYIINLAGFESKLNSGSSGMAEWPDSDDKNCWKVKDPRAVAEYFRFCDGQKPGVVPRLNQRMRDGWNDWMVDDALAKPAQHACESFNFLKHQQSSSISSI